MNLHLYVEWVLFRSLSDLVHSIPPKRPVVNSKMIYTFPFVELISDIYGHYVQYLRNVSMNYKNFAFFTDL